MGNVTPIKPRRGGVAFEPPSEVAALKAELAALKAKTAAPKESATQIAARIRAGMGPTRPIVQRELERRENEKWL